MKSVKRGRAHSMRSGVGGVFAAIFGVIWMIAALSMGAPPIFPLFGLIFIGFAVSNAIFDFKNAASKQRYSEYDIVEEGEEPDLLNERFGGQNEEESASAPRRDEFAFCPYCGAKLDKGDIYCGKCGKRIA